MHPPSGNPPDRLVRLKEVMRIVGLGKTMIYRKIKEGSFPRPYKPSPFASRWSEREVLRWVARIKGDFEI
jgi:prophage regulatory protein